VYFGGDGRAVVVGVPSRSACHAIDSVRRAHQKAHHVHPVDVLLARARNRDAVLLCNPVELGRECRRRHPRVEGFLLDRHDVHAAAQAALEVLEHGVQRAGKRHDGDVGWLRREHSLGVVVDNHARLEPQIGDLTEVTPNLLRASRNRPHNLNALLHHQARQDLPHRPDSVDDASDPTGAPICELVRPTRTWINDGAAQETVAAPTISATCRAARWPLSTQPSIQPAGPKARSGPANASRPSGCWSADAFLMT
jgi:hypothetical protein